MKVKGHLTKEGLDQILKSRVWILKDLLSKIKFWGPNPKDRGGPLLRDEVGGGGGEGPPIVLPKRCKKFKSNK
jgi:hypothetical protein